MKHGQGRYRYDMVCLGSNIVKFKHGEARPPNAQILQVRMWRLHRKNSKANTVWRRDSQSLRLGDSEKTQGRQIVVLFFLWEFQVVTGMYTILISGFSNIDECEYHDVMHFWFISVEWCANPCTQVGNHNYGQLLDFSLLDENEFSERSVNLSNYAELKARMAERCGMHVRILRFSETVSEAQLITIIQGADLAALPLFFVLNLSGPLFSLFHFVPLSPWSSNHCFLGDLLRFDSNWSVAM